MPLLFAGCSQLAVSKDYICSLVEQANSKMHSKQARVRRFFELLRQQSQPQLAAVPLPEGQATQQENYQHVQLPSSKQSMLEGAPLLLLLRHYAKRSAMLHEGVKSFCMMLQEVFLPAVVPSCCLAGKYSAVIGLH